ncbi:MAG TPA: efflux RND transporter periplasmic adaptor subunit [Limnobacter sp.]|uniref:efflux RND transporter periplasmic adaptor subunit n=1 Tax=Limnobacter sp. TaxID=2003368 RepID=UPI002E331BE1|nr:efflux RND transporter periplasmic adaptor subunit [Limnobacter sp.]HEX5486955.1 efflux RND transporter periplasmic adaptor subunit [Limnobacter sp.]
MKQKTILTALLAAGLLAGTGFGFYEFGMQQGMNMTAAGGSPATSGQTNPKDPSTWGIPEGEAATRRHIQEGLKAGDTDPVTGQKILYYHDPMVPGKNFDSPGKSPFMDMMLVPAYGGGSSDTGTVTISPRIEQNLGMRTALVQAGRLESKVSTVGAIAWNERELTTLQARASGYVEKLYVKATLDPVRKGQALLDLYVPDWVAVQEDYLALQRMQGDNLATLREAALARMRQAGMDDQQIAQVKKAGKVQARVTVFSPQDGVITELNAREGMTVMPGSNLMQLNGLDKVWSYAEVPENQAPLLRVGQTVAATTPALPGQTFTGKVQAILPQVDPKTRTLKARLELDNTAHTLVPGMFVNMAFADQQGHEALLVPTQALIRTGQRTLVMVAEQQGQYRPVEVTTGESTADKTEILAGLKAGQQVVVSGQFLLDSEASLKGLEARLPVPNPAPGGTP